MFEGHLGFMVGSIKRKRQNQPLSVKVLKPKAECIGVFCNLEGTLRVSGWSQGSRLHFALLPRLYHIYKDSNTGNVGDQGVNQRSVTSPGQTRLDPVPKDKVEVMGLYLSLFIRHTSHIKSIPA